MKTNIVILGLDYEYNLDIAQLLADKTSLYFLDVKQYLNYSLFSRQEMEAKCGIDYLIKQENSVVKSCADFENTIICMPYMYFFRDNIYQRFFDNCEIIYLYFSKQKLQKIAYNNSSDNTLAIDILAFEDRNADINKISNIKVCVSNKNKQTVVKEILNNLGVTCEY